MTSAKPNIQFQLGEAIAVIADSDFWERWETLVDVCWGITIPIGQLAYAMQDLVSRLNLDNLAVNNGVLQVAHTIFKRWRPLYRSDALFTEINHVLGKFGAPFLAQLQVKCFLHVLTKGQSRLTCSRGSMPRSSRIIRRKRHCHSSLPPSICS